MTQARAIAMILGLAALAGCAAPPDRAPEGLRPVEAVPLPAERIAGTGPAPVADLRPIPPGPRAEAAKQAAAAAMATPPPEARRTCTAEFATRFRLPDAAVLMGEQGRTAAGWFVDLGRPDSDRTWRCQTDPAGRVVTVTPR
ncbi:hypothetical protein [Rhodovulum marinum]|uniref:Peptidase inhibitor I78 family protein n=1 Tax=Rhodovulum marinum TaxID=320662 RepID=A0A4R2Q5Q3_9RHOB|nr:hypothetical protein [Rhodovulum marinum]TCP43148.1 hypothetical protein EV662_102341 [Rhodovulum marinum]